MKILQKIIIITSILTMLAHSALAYSMPPIAIGRFEIWKYLLNDQIALEARTPINKNLYLRTGVNYSPYLFLGKFNSKALRVMNKFRPKKIKITKGEKQCIEFLEKLLSFPAHQNGVKLFSVPVMFDIHPFSSSGFKISLGLAYNGNKIYSVKDSKDKKHIYKPFLPISPIVSIGYDDSFINDSSWSNYYEFGIMYNGAFRNSKGDKYGSCNKYDKTTELLMRFNPIIKIGTRYVY